jgi:hypothetical protein
MVINPRKLGVPWYSRLWAWLTGSFYVMTADRSMSSCTHVVLIRQSRKGKLTVLRDFWYDPPGQWLSITRPNLPDVNEKR